MSTEQAERKRSLVEVFMGGAKGGFYVGVEQILPSMILGYTIVEFLKITGLMDIIGVIFGPVMAIFGLPGTAITVLLSAFFSKAAGAATAANMFTSGMITVAQATILVMPCMLMGTLIAHYARIVLVSDVNPKYRIAILIVPLLSSAIAMLFMRCLLTITGAM